MRVISKENLLEAVEFLKKGKTMVFPTETSYGLGCDATNQEAVDKIFKIKGRKNDKPLLVVVPNVEMAKKYLVWNDLLEDLSKKYWPGPLTVVGKYLEPPLFKEGRGEVNIVRRIAFNRTLENRQQLRENKTTAEKILWSQLKGKQMNGLKFRRQHGVGPYIVDFYQPDTKTIIEVDGDIHFIDDKAIRKDVARIKWFENMGYRVMRFNNVDVIGKLEDVLGYIYYNLTSPRHIDLPSPLLKKRGNDRLAIDVVSPNNTIAIRVTAHPLLKFLSEKLGLPVVATSANLADTGDIYDSKQIIEVFSRPAATGFGGARPDIIIDGGELPHNSPTTIVSVVDNLKILRQGQTRPHRLAKHGGQVKIN